MSASTVPDYNGDRMRIVRQQAGDAAELYLAVANMQPGQNSEVAAVEVNSAAATGIETAASVARTQADIISNASQALLAQANVGPQSVIDLLEA